MSASAKSHMNGPRGSIRARLILILLAGTGVVWLSAVAWIFLSTQAEVERVLDARLMEAARMVNSLLTDHRIEVAVAAAATTGADTDFGLSDTPYQRQLSCQIWSLSGGLVGRSEGAPASELSPASDGFSETTVDGETWRVYAVSNADLGVRVLIGDSLAVRDRLVSDVIKGLLLPAAVVVPVLALMIWFGVRGGLLPLSRLAGTLAGRPADDLRPLPTDHAPGELRPPLAALNGLFRRVDAARQRERSFTAFAAHELKTPLAGLKTQAQIALASGEPQIQANALAQIVTGVDRASRLVRQLLDLAAMDAAAPEAGLVTQDLGDMAAQAVAEIAPVAAGREVCVDLARDGEDLRAPVEPHFLFLALRNVLENAVLHASAGGTVICRVGQAGVGQEWVGQNGVGQDGAGQELVVEICDDGPGMEPGEIAQATERFFRGSRRSGAGSGLGLSIAQLALERLGGRLGLQNRPEGGFRVTLAVPRHRPETAERA